MITVKEVRPEPAIRPALAGLDDDSLPSVEEGTPIPYLAGEGVLTGKPISPIYNQRAVEAKDPRPGKK
jgi:hypothetical protein